MTLLRQNAVPVNLPTFDRCFFHWQDLTNSASDRAFSRTVPVYLSHTIDVVKFHRQRLESIAKAV